MRIETLCTGDELLTGLIADTNSQFFQTQLLERHGLTVSRSTVVGDDERELSEVMRELAQRCEVVLVSGGLGPTSDDITVPSAAKAFGVEVIEDQRVLAHLRERYARRGVQFTENNALQARVLAGSEAVLNTEGSAPLIVLTQGRCTFFFVPGVPREYRHLVSTFVLPRIAARRPSTHEHRRLRVLKTLGIPESHLDARLRPLFSKHPLVTWGYRTHAPENHVKLLVKASNDEEAQEALGRAETDVRLLLGEAIFGTDDELLAQVLGRTLLKRSFTLAVAESCTGGLISAACTEIEGASEWFLGGAATYAASAKAIWAGVNSVTIESHGVVSGEVARAMAEGVQKALGASCGLSVTGYAGPTGGDATNPVGTVFVGVATPKGSHVERHHFAGDRPRVRQFAAWSAMDALRRAVLRG